MSVVAILERTVAPLDQLRRVWFALMLRSDWLSRLFTRREQRTVTLAILHGSVAFLFALFAPVVLFVLGPVLLGVVHVAADVRYLVVRQKLQVWWRNAIWLFCLLLISVRVLWEAEVPANLARAETLLVVSWIFLAIVAAVRQSGAYSRAAFAMLGLIVLGTLSLSYPLEARLVFAHVHNFVALALWGLVLRGRLSTLLIPALFVLVAAGALLSGVLYRVPLEFGASAFDLHVLEAAEWLAPGLRTDYAVGFLCAYVFLQSIHYAIWLILIPQQQAPGQGTLTFRMSARSLVRDFGAFGVVAIASTALLIVGSACFEVLRTRSLYLSLAMFHAYLELAFLAYFWVKGRAAQQTAETTQVAQLAT